MIKKYLQLCILLEILGGAIIIAFPAIVNFNFEMTFNEQFWIRFLGVQAVLIGLLLLVINKSCKNEGSLILAKNYFIIYNLIAALWIGSIYFFSGVKTLFAAGTHFSVFLLGIILQLSGKFNNI